MRQLWILLVVLTAVLAGCGGRSASVGRGQCEEGLCVRMEIDGPVRRGKPIVVQITATSQERISNLGISLMYQDKEIVVDEADGPEPGQVVWRGEWGLDWSVDAQAGQPIILERKIHLPDRKGPIYLMASAMTPRGLRVVDSVSIYFSGEKGEIYRSGTLIPVTPPPLLVYTVTPGPSPTPLPTNTPWPIPPPTYPPPERTPTQVSYPYPIVSPQPPLPVPTREAYP